jgi:hypothetical protein
MLSASERHLSAYLQFVAGRDRQRRKGGAGVNAHAKLGTTMEIYAHPRMETKRIAQSRVADILFDHKPQSCLDATA